MGASVERDLPLFLWLMSVDFPELTSHAGGASGQVITPQDREGERQNCLDSEVLRMVKVAWPISEGVMEW